MDGLISSRTPALIAAEVNLIKDQTTNVVLVGSIEIGRRLKEVKAMLPHGEWGRWLEESVCYSQNTAIKLMRLYEGYGSKQPATLNAGTQVPEEIAELNPTQAYLLLGVPEAEREQFIAELDVKHMSTRELEKAVQERNQARKERDEALRRASELEQAMAAQAGKMSVLGTKHDGLEKEAKELRKFRQENETINKNLQKDLDDIKKSTKYKELERKDREIIAAYSKVSANRVAYLLDDLDKRLKELTFEMKGFAAKDPEGFEMYKQRLVTVLTRGLTIEM